MFLFFVVIVVVVVDIIITVVVAVAMIKINNECVSKCLLHCLEQTESKYGEALTHSYGLTKHTVFVLWKILEM